MLFHIPILNTSTSWVPLNLAPHTCSPPNDAPIFFRRRPLINLLRHHRLHDELHAHTWTECSVLLEQENPAPPALLHQMRAAFLLTRVLPLSSPTNASLTLSCWKALITSKIIPCTHRLITFVPLVCHCCALLSSSCKKPLCAQVHGVLLISSPFICTEKSTKYLYGRPGPPHP